MPVERLKRYFLRGLAALLPTILTLWIFIWGYRFIQQHIGYYINRIIVWLMVLIQAERIWTRQQLYGFWVEGIGSVAGFLAAVIIVCIVGIILASFIGKALWRAIERFIMNTPFLSRVYPYVKQVTDFLLDEERLAVSRVVAVEYPRKGSWSLGFVTGSGIKAVQDNTGKEMVAVLIPTSPTPLTGFVIMVANEDLIDLNISIEEAFRFTVSGGVVSADPHRQLPK